VSTHDHLPLGRRRFLTRAAALTSVLAGVTGEARAEDPPPETRKIRILHVPAICHAPQYIAEELLRLEGFTDIEYVQHGARYIPAALAGAKADLSMWNAAELIPHIEANAALSVLAGIHGGCFEVFAREDIRSIRDLRGKTVAVTYLGGGDHLLLASMLAYVGIDPGEVRWLPGTTTLLDAMEIFVSGRADVYVGFAQQPVELRARRIGHVILDTTTDKPWSQYFCCVLVANRDFVRRHPVATKRALRAILKAADLCDTAPDAAARFLSAKLYEPRLRIGMEVLEKLEYSRWRDANPEDTIRFHALRLREVGMIRSQPDRLIAQGVDTRFLLELRRELKS